MPSWHAGQGIRESSYPAGIAEAIAHALYAGFEDAVSAAKRIGRRRRPVRAWRIAGDRRAVSSEPASANRVLNELGASAEFQLAHGVCLMCFDRLDTDGQPACDLFVRIAPHNEPKNCCFTDGQAGIATCHEVSRYEEWRRPFRAFDSVRHGTHSARDLVTLPRGKSRQTDRITRPESAVSN
jgi:hypothetical protein